MRNMGGTRIHGLKTVCEASVERRDDIHHHLDINSLSEYRTHVKRRANYSTSKLPNERQKCISSVVSVSRDSMAQCGNEVRTDLVNWVERLKDDGKEMMIACNFNIFLFSAFGRCFRCFSCWGCTSGWHTQVRGGHCVSNCDVPGSAATITPWNESEPIVALVIRP